MPFTSVLNAYSHSYPFITNRLQASIFLQSSPQAFISSIIDATAGHPARTWSFPGLPRNNYGFSLDEIDGAGNVVANLALFDVVPGQIQGTLARDDEQIRVGGTVGLVAGTNTFTFDGTGGKPDYIGWDIVPSELTGRGIMVEGVDYSWNINTGQFAFLQVGDVFQADTYFNIHFNSQENPAGGSINTNTDFSIKLKTTTYSVLVADFGTKIIVEPVGDFVALLLPSIATVPQGRKLYVEIGGADCCLQVVPFGANPIKFLRGTLYALPNEKFSIYAYNHTTRGLEWRVDDLFGNFHLCGQLVSDDAIQASLFGKQLLDGTIGSISRYSRIYYEIVSNLPPSQKCNFDDWLNGNNKYLYSLANSANPTYLNKFHFPDRRNLYERNNNTGKAGDYQKNVVKPHRHGFPAWVDVPGNAFGVKTIPARTVEDFTVAQANKTEIHVTDDGSGDGLLGTDTETRPETYLINKYVLL